MAKTFSELQALALQIRDEILEKKNTAPRVGAALLDMIDNTIQNITDINQKLSVFEHVCSGFKRVQSESQLPVTPPQDEKAVGYLVGKNLYLYVEEGGNAVSGRYFNVGDITGPQGEPGPQGLVGPVGPKGEQGNSGVTGPTDNIEVVNNLDGGESTPERIKVLAAEQGKVLNGKILELINKSQSIESEIKDTVDKQLIDTDVVWIDGVWDWETNSSAGNTVQKQSYKHVKMLNVGHYDSLQLTGLAEKVDVSDTFPSISIYNGSEQIEYLRGDSAVIKMDKYSDRSNINIVIQTKKDGSLIPSVVANSKAKVLKPEDIMPIKSSLSRLEGVEKDIIPDLEWVKQRWETGTNQPNGGEASYNSSQKIWYTRIDISKYDSIICNQLVNGSPYSNDASTFNGICIYGDGTFIKGYTDASNEIIIDREGYSQYSKLELIIQCKSTSDSEFVAQGNPSVNTIIYSTVASKVEVDNLTLNVTKNSSDIKEINNLIAGVDNEDIFLSFIWNKKRWLTGTNQPNGADTSYNAVQKIWRSDKFNISNYDTITIKGLSNNSAYSNNANTLSAYLIYGDDNLVKESTDGTGPITINRSDYNQYSKLELLLQTKSTSDTEFIAEGDPSVIVYKAGIAQEQPKPKRIVLDGDSLCGNNTALIRYELGNILKNRGYELIPRTQGGEKTIGNLTRAGGIGIRVKAEFIIPTSGSVNCALESAWIKSDGNYQDTPYNMITDGQNVQVVINGIRGKLAKSETNAVGIAFYTSSGAFISSLTDSGTFNIPSNATQYAFTVNDPATGEPHITINGDAVEDLSSKATRTGYINNAGTFVSSDGFKCSELLPISQGEIYIDSLAASTGYVFTRLEEGTEVKIGIGYVFFDAALYDDRDYPHIWFTGQNMGYESEEDWANMVMSAANNFSDKYIVCSTPLTGTNNKLIYQANKCFGAKYLNLRAYTQGQAVYDGQKLGLISTRYSASDYENLFWPGSDKIHQNNLLSYIWAVKMWNTMLELGYVEGERVETGDYYLP